MSNRKRGSIEQKAEPVAYLCENAVGHKYCQLKKPSDIYKPIGLYTAPPQREWQGLTPDEVKHLYPYGRSVWSKETFEAIEKALKDKNT